jgi:hypothetical protein
MVRLRGLAVLLLLVAAACGGSASSANDVSPVRDLTLRLPDLPPGYIVGDDTGCGNVGTEDAPSRLEELIRRLHPRACNVLFERAWASTSPDRQPAVVGGVCVRTTAVGAKKQHDDAPEVASYLLEPDTFELVAGRSGLGEDALVVRTQSALVTGRPGNPGVAVVWRSGPVLGIVLGADPVAPKLQERVLELAAVQQRRIEAPTPLQQSELDDREVALDDPLLGIRVVWLGRTFAPQGLPVLELNRAYGPIGSPGNRVQIDYMPPGSTGPGVILFLWTKQAWERFTRTRLGRLVWSSPCARATRVDVRGGRAVIYVGYYATGGTRRPCPLAPPDRLLAHVFFRDLVVAVNMPLCYLCPGRSVARGADAYNTVRGLRAVVRSLRERR